jgi:hypothetical protein
MPVQTTRKCGANFVVGLGGKMDLGRKNVIFFPSVNFFTLKSKKRLSEGVKNKCVFFFSS